MSGSATTAAQPANRRTWLAKLLGEQARKGPPITAIDMIPARREALHLDALNQDLPALAALHEGVVLTERDGGELSAEIYVPEGTGPFPPVLYMHGGAFCVWSARDVRRIATTIAASGHVVVNLDYGLAPERPFPCAVQDTIYAARWITRNIRDYGGDDGPIAIGGDSAGANLSCAAIAYLNGCPAELDEGDLAGVDVAFSAALLLCGAYDFRARLGRRDTTPGTTEVMSNLAYLGSHFLSKHEDPMVSPIRAPNLGSFPSVYLNCGSEDALLPDTLEMTAKFGEVGVSTTASIVDGVDHEFLLLDPTLPHIAREWQRMLEWLEEKAAVARAS